MKKLFPIIAFLAVAVVSLVTAGLAYYAAQDASRIKFEATADDALNRIESRVDLNVSLLLATHALFAARGGNVSPEEFKAYFDALSVDKNFDGLRGMGFLGLVQHGDDAALVAVATRYRGSPVTVYPDSNAEWRAPILMFEPLDASNQASIGYDMFSEPVRREAIESALAVGEPRASGRVLLGQQTGSQSVFPGFFVFAALDAPATATGAAGKGKAAGVLYVAFRSEGLLKAALDKFPVLPVHATVFDGKPEPANLLFESGTPVSDAFAQDFVASRTLLVAGRSWTIQFRPTVDFSQPTSRLAPILLGLFGLLAAAAIARVARYQQRAYDAMSELQETGEKNLLEKDLMLQEMKHRIKNSIARVLAIARQTAAGAKDVGEFSQSFSARLQAMAASQDMLTRSRWQKADLGELLRIELAQVFGKDLPDDMVDGPRVLLSETMTQALGLTFHELATNALKYGEAGNSPDALQVRWLLHSKNKAEKLELVWRESGGKVVKVPQKSGFGTKLIDLNITGELGGTITRNYRADGLEIEIVVPLGGKDK